MLGGVVEILCVETHPWRYEWMDAPLGLCVTVDRTRGKLSSERVDNDWGSFALVCGLYGEGGQAYGHC